MVGSIGIRDGDLEKHTNKNTRRWEDELGIKTERKKRKVMVGNGSWRGEYKET